MEDLWKIHLPPVYNVSSPLVMERSIPFRHQACKRWSVQGSLTLQEVNCHLRSKEIKSSEFYLRNRQIYDIQISGQALETFGYSAPTSRPKLINPCERFKDFNLRGFITLLAYFLPFNNVGYKKLAYLTNFQFFPGS